MAESRWVVAELGSGEGRQKGGVLIFDCSDGCIVLQFNKTHWIVDLKLMNFITYKFTKF
jgi:hypothetical protein